MQVKTMDDFIRLTDKFYAEDAYKYGSIQYPAKAAMLAMEKEGVTNAKELYESFRNSQGSNFYYAGD